MGKKVLVPIADGCEEIETACIVDVLRRAGASVTVASVGTLQVTASRGMKLVADKFMSECVKNTYDLIVLPGRYARCGKSTRFKRISGNVEAAAAVRKIVCGHMRLSCGGIATPRPPEGEKGNRVSKLCRLT